MASSSKPIKALKITDPAAAGFPANYTIEDKVILQVTDLNNNNNKYYAIELHQAQDAAGVDVFRVFTHYGRTDDLEQKPTAGIREVRACANLAEAQSTFDAIRAEKTSSKKGYVEVKLASSKIGSRPVASAPVVAVSAATAITSTLPAELTKLVELLYNEATTSLTSTVQATITENGIETPLGVLTPQQIDSGDAFLAQIYHEFQTQKRRDILMGLSGDFYSAIPHRLGRSKAALEAACIDTLPAIVAKQETLQLMRDLVRFKAGVLLSHDIDQKYAALGCDIAALTGTEADEIATFVETSQVKTKTVRVKRVFRLARGAEASAFRSDVGNAQRLLHGSRVSNWAGILSRGLVLPKVGVSLGVNRTDEGWLGHGIYFAEAACAASFYAHGNTTGTRLLAVAEVALGEMKEFTKINYGLTAPPPGYNSCHGLRSRPGLRSQFEDDEYAVYDPAQQRLQYLVEFTA